jgi:hypothetical protein
MQLDHEKLDVYRVSLDFAAWSYSVAAVFSMPMPWASAKD